MDALEPFHKTWPKFAFELCHKTWPKFAFAGAVENIRQNGLEATMQAKECAECGFWHVRPKPKTSRFVVTISRTWSRISQLRNALEHVHEHHPGGVLVHGDAPRGDRTAAGIWREFGGKSEAWPASWETGRSAGIRRSREMVESGPMFVLAFIRNKSRGATFCADYATKKGIRVVRYIHDGEDE